MAGAAHKAAPSSFRALMAFHPALLLGLSRVGQRLRENVKFNRNWPSAVPLAQCHATRLWSSMRKFPAIALPLLLISIPALADDEIAVAASLQTFVDVCGPLVAPTRLTRQGK